MTDNKIGVQNFTLTKTNEEICNAITKPKPLPGSAINLLDYRYLTMGPVLKLELLPMLNRIIAPPLRPVSLPQQICFVINCKLELG